MITESSSSTSRRPIDQRFVPPVAGVDLQQALNYIDLDVVGESFVYEHYTSRRIFHVPGSRPKLEQAATIATNGASSDLQAAQLLATWVARHVRWAGYYFKDKRRRLPTDRCPSEEQLLDEGYGWCNEQARLFCLLAQISGIPSRIVFAINKMRGYGHCIAEVMLVDGWMAVDQSFGFCFAMNQTPVRASRVFHDPVARAYFIPLYTKLCRDMVDELGPVAEKDFAMAASEDALDGFTSLGFHNYFTP